MKRRKGFHRIRNILAIVWTAVICATYRYIVSFSQEIFWESFFLFVMTFLLTAVGSHVVLKHFPLSTRERIYSVYRICESKIDDIFSGSNFFLMVWGVLTISYIPAYLAFFPGIFGYDTPVQVAMFYGDITLTSHHPLAHTCLLGAFFRLGEAVFDSCQIGFALYSAMQGLVVTGSLAYMFDYLRKRHIPFLVIVIGVLYSVLNPLNQIIAFNATKDVLFGAFLLCFSVSVLNILEEGEQNAVDYMRLCVFGVLMCLFRNQGIYILAFWGAGALLMRVSKRKMYVFSLAAFVLAEGFFLFFSKVIGIPDGDKREMLSVPIQQIAYTTYQFLEGKEVVVTQEQLEQIERVIQKEGILSLAYDTADPVKACFNTNVFIDNLGEQVSTYFALGVENPVCFRDAWFYLIYPYWCINTDEYLGLVYADAFPELNRWGVGQAGVLEFYYDYLVGKVNRISNGDIGLLEHQETCLWLLALLLGIAFLRGSKKLVLGILPFLLYMGTMLLGPVALFRYLFPLTLACPLLFGLFFDKNDTAKA